MCCMASLIGDTHFVNQFWVDATGEPDDAYEVFEVSLIY